MNNEAILNYISKAPELVRNNIGNNKSEIVGKTLLIKVLLRNSTSFDLTTVDGWQSLMTAERTPQNKAVWELINEGSYFKSVPLERLVSLINLADQEGIDDLTGSEFSYLIAFMTSMRNGLINYDISFLPLFVRLARLDENTQVYANSLLTLPMLGNVLDESDIYFELLEQSPLVYAFEEIFKDHVDVRLTDIYTKPTFVDTSGSLEKFDVGITFPPPAHRIQSDEINKIIESDTLRRFGVVSRSTEILTIQHTLSQVDGLVIAFVPQGILFNAIEKPFREFIISEKLLKEIIFLPLGSLNGAGIATAILVFDTRGGHDTVRFVDLSSAGYIRKNRRSVELINLDKLMDKIDSNEDFEGIGSISCEQIIQEDYAWTAQRYPLTLEQKEFSKHMGKAPTSELVELVSFERALPAFSRNEKGNIPVFEVAVSDMEGGYLKPPSKEVLVSKRTINEAYKSFLKPKDIIISTKGSSLGKVAFVADNVPPAGENGWVVSQFALILRVKETSKISPEVLFVYLRSPLGQKLIERFVEGSAMVTLSLANLKTLPVIQFSQEDEQNAARIVDGDLEAINKIQQLKAESEKRYQSMWYLD